MNAYKPYLYLEDKLIKQVLSVSVSTGINMPLSAMVTLPFSVTGTQILPGTRVIFLLEDKNGIFVWFTGETVDRPMIGVGIGNKLVTLKIKSDFGVLGDIQVNPTNPVAVTQGVGMGANMMESLSGTVKIPTVASEIGFVQMIRLLLGLKSEGKVKGEKKEEESQSNKAAAAKGRIFGLLQGVIMQSPNAMDKLRRNKFLDRMAIHIDESAVALLLNQGEQGLFSNNLLSRLFNQRKTLLQILGEYLSIFFHEFVSMAPWRGGVYLDVPDRDVMYLPKGFAKYIHGEKTEKIDFESFMAVLRDQYSVMEVMIKPKMPETFSPECNVLQPEDYSMFSFSENINITRMVSRNPITKGFSSNIIDPPVLRDVYDMSLKYGKRKDRFVAYSDMLFYGPNDYLTNEEIILGKSLFTVTNINHLVSVAYSKELIKDNKTKYDEELKKYQKKVDDYAFTAFSPIYTKGGSRDKIEAALRKKLEKAKISPTEAARAAKKVIDSYLPDINGSKMSSSEMSKIVEDVTKDYASNLTNHYKAEKTSSSQKPTESPRNAKPFTAKPPEEQSITSDQKRQALAQESGRLFDAAREGNLEVQGRFNLEPVPGFSITILDPKGQDVVGYLVAKTDVIDFAAGSATTAYKIVGGRTFVRPDYNRHLGDGKFALDIYGTNPFAWGKFFDYSSTLYKKYLKCSAFVPKSMRTIADDIFTQEYKYKTSEKEAEPTYVSLDKLLDIQGLMMKKVGNDLDMSTLLPDDRTVDLGKYYPSFNAFDKFEDPFKQKERFYVVADTLALKAEEEFKNNNKLLLQVLDSRFGKYHLLFAKLNDKELIHPYVHDFFKKYQDSMFDEVNEYPIWLGNPAVPFTSLFFSYLSCFYDKPLTAKDVWGSGAVPSKDELKKLEKATEDKSFETMFIKRYGLSEKSAQALMGKIKEFTTSKKDISFEKLGLSEDELKKVKIAYAQVSGYTDVFLSLAGIISPKEWDDKGLDSPPVPRPISEFELTKTKMNIIKNMLEEFERYVR